MNIIINGIEYEYIDPNPKTKQSSSKSRSLSKILAMAMTLPYTNIYGGMPKIKERQRPDVNFIEEYQLIVEKKSKLSRSDRDWVERQFNYYYKPVKKGGSDE